MPTTLTTKIPGTLSSRDHIKPLMTLQQTIFPFIEKEIEPIDAATNSTTFTLVSSLCRNSAGVLQIALAYIAQCDSSIIHNQLHFVINFPLINAVIVINILLRNIWLKWFNILMHILFTYVGK